ncbi:hypothetical protein [Pseudomonas sp. NPDC089569]|uniref:hypothetical protein n=1 Tax=Pseudomonas sp. NPDC089569 TaxID=3390722 RepID=UPI003D04FC52
MKALPFSGQASDRRNKLTQGLLPNIGKDMTASDSPETVAFREWLNSEFVDAYRKNPDAALATGLELARKLSHEDRQREVIHFNFHVNHLIQIGSVFGGGKGRFFLYSLALSAVIYAFTQSMWAATPVVLMLAAACRDRYVCGEREQAFRMLAATIDPSDA